MVLNPTTSPGTAGILSQTCTTIITRTFRHFQIVRIMVSITDHKTMVSTTERKTHKPIFGIGHPTISSKESTLNYFKHILILIPIPQILILFLQVVWQISPRLNCPLALSPGKIRAVDVSFVRLGLKDCHNVVRFFQEPLNLIPPPLPLNKLLIAIRYFNIHRSPVVYD